ncbi:hypothetical protein FS837_001377 [Tulasnella sp. UAMH 9824]|nr:hypothetical protein FS837_001377 [Tulasnella sp. UAMH 9824]
MSSCGRLRESDKKAEIGEIILQTSQVPSPSPTLRITRTTLQFKFTASTPAISRADSEVGFANLIEIVDEKRTPFDNITCNKHDSDRRTDKSGPSYFVSEGDPNLAIPVVQWNGGCLSELKTPELHFSSNHPAYANSTVSGILAILSNCPRLQSLTYHLMVTEYEMEWADTEADPNLPTIDLSALQHFSLIAPAPYSASLLSGLA